MHSNCRFELSRRIQNANVPIIPEWAKKQNCVENRLRSLRSWVLKRQCDSARETLTTHIVAEGPWDWSKLSHSKARNDSVLQFLTAVHSRSRIWDLRSRPPSPSQPLLRSTTPPRLKVSAHVRICSKPRSVTTASHPLPTSTRQYSLN